MMKSVVIGALALFAGISPVCAQSCASGMQQNLTQMAQNAVRCGESADLMSSIQRGGSGRANIEELASSCRSGRSVTSQLSAFNECSRTYVCASLAYAYAIENLNRYSGDCTAAANAGFVSFRSGEYFGTDRLRCRDTVAATRRDGPSGIAFDV